MKNTEEKPKSVDNKEVFMDLKLLIKQKWNAIIDIFAWKSNYSFFLLSILLVNFV